MKTMTRWLAVLLLGFSSLALALDLDTAKAQGLIGEQPNGYLGVVQTTPAAVKLATDINTQRRAAYDRIARENGIPLDQVATLAGQKAIERTASGGYVKTPGGQWVRK
jgi:uncharacterized protein YdbL (DUF1318 family)